MNSMPSSPRLPATPCADSRPAARPSVGAFLVWSAVFAGTGIATASGHPWQQGVLYLVGVALGVVLTHVGFDFASAYRRLFVDRDAGPVRGHLWLLAATLILFAPVLALGEGWGLTVRPSVAPLTLSIVAGAFLFGVGMQLAGGCSVGSLYALGGGNARMGVVLVFFCIGALMASLRAHALWGAKAAALIGWDPTTSTFWQDPFPASALGGGLLDDVTSMMNIAMVIGAAGATLAALVPGWRRSSAGCSWATGRVLPSAATSARSWPGWRPPACTAGCGSPALCRASGWVSSCDRASV
jgi:uncharacterized membrane protein YedE/YeeE